MWCCNTFWEGGEKWVTLRVIPEEQNCFTDELCHCATSRQTMLQQAGLYALRAYLESDLSLYFLGYCIFGWFVLPTIYEEMWTEILIEIKNKHYEKASLGLPPWLLLPMIIYYHQYYYY